MIKDIVQTILQRLQISIWTSEAFLFEMQLDLIRNLKWIRNTMLIVSGIRFCIISLQHFLCLLLNVVYLVLKHKCFLNFSSVEVDGVWMCKWTDHVDVHWGLKSIIDLKWNLSCRVMLSTIVTLMYVWETFIPCLMMLVVVHAKQLYYQAIHNFRVSVYLRMESCR